MYRIAAARHRGDPFSIGGLFGGIAKTIGGLVPGPAGMVLKAAGGLLQGKPKPSPQQVVTQVGPGGMIYKRTEFGGQVNLPQIGPGAGGKAKRFGRRINPANVKALRRAIRRQDQFVNLAKSVGMRASCNCGGRAKLRGKKARRR